MRFLTHVYLHARGRGWENMPGIASHLANQGLFLFFFVACVYLYLGALSTPSNLCVKLQGFNTNADMQRQALRHTARAVIGVETRMRSLNAPGAT